MRWPTPPDIPRLAARSDNYSQIYLGVQRGKERTADSPPPLMVGHHYALTAADTYNNNEHGLTLPGMLAGSDIRPNMTLAVGTVADPFVYGSARIRWVDVATNTLYLEPNNIFANGHFITGDVIWVDGVYRLYRKLPYIPQLPDANAGTVYEDGNPDTVAGGAGIPGNGLGFVANYLYRPCALMGSPRFAWTGETIDFYGWRSFGRGGWTIANWLWNFDGGVCTGPGVGFPGSPASPIHARWNTAGEYIASLLVTDNSGRAGTDDYGVMYSRHRAVRPVLVYDRPGIGPNTPYTDFEINGLSGRYGSGWTCRLTVHGTADKSEFPDNAMIILFAEDWHGDVRHSMGGWYGQEGILFVGYVRAGSVQADSEKSTVSFEARTIEDWMNDIDVWPANFVNTAGAPAAWKDFQNMTIEDTLWYLAEFRSNLKDVTDCFFCSDPNGAKRVDFLDLTEASLYDQMSSQIGSCFFGQVSASRSGSIHLFKHKNMWDLAERRLGSIPVRHFQREDWRDELDIGEERMRDSVAQVDFVGFIYDATGNPQEVFSLAPQRQTNFGGIEKVTGILLTGATIAAAQPESNTLSGLYRAWKNIRFPHIRVPVFNDRFLEPATLDYFAVTLSSTVRGLNWAKKEFLTTEASYSFDNERGILLVEYGGEASTWGPDGVAGDYPHADYGDDPTDNEGEAEIPSNFPGDNPVGEYYPPGTGTTKGDGNLVYFVADNGHVYRTRNALAASANVVYEDLGDATGGAANPRLRWIALDPFDPVNRAMVAGDDGCWYTTTLNTAAPAWVNVYAAGGNWWCYQVVASEVQQGHWMLGLYDSGANLAYARWSVNNGTDAFANLVTGGALGTVPVSCEFSAHTPNMAWIVYERTNQVHVLVTTTLWATFAWHDIQPPLTGVTGPYACCHRWLLNPSDNHVVWGSDGDVAKCGNDFIPASCSTAQAMTGALGTYIVGCWRFSTDRWWALGSPRYINGVWQAPPDYRLWDSRDGRTWVQRYNFDPTNTVWHRHVSDFRWNERYFYASQDTANGAVAPLMVSVDYGNTFTNKVGNWNAIGGATGFPIEIWGNAVVWE